MYYILMEEFFGGQDWMELLVAICHAQSIDVDGIVVLQTFVELFYCLHMEMDFDLHLIIRDICTAY